MARVFGWLALLVLGEYVNHYNTHRPNRTLHHNSPAGRPCPPLPYRAHASSDATGSAA